jgi:dTDP-4-dehydrorhamnose reductase
MDRLEIWGGIECSIARIGDRYHRQLRLSGHDRRPEDIAAIAELGIRTLRYPILWEDVAPHGLDHADWRWADERLGLLRHHSIAPIVGLLHHGSGPAWTGLLDDAFPRHFAEYAGAVAARYPWVDAYMPVNEPLTTARFSALYGHWYPHARDDRSFVRALLNQCRATVLAMLAIRRSNPQAKLIQTDDVGKTFSIRELAYQARFDNARRWLAWDLLCGRVGGRHPLRKYLVASGASATELDWFRANACPPDLIGINHYVTSNRYLHRNPAWSEPSSWGGNGIDRYADTEAVRVPGVGYAGLAPVIREVWRRYRIPIAVTEAHLGCTREEQLRWLAHAWQSARDCRRAGIDVRAVTAWALFGSFDWNSLLTRSAGHYETGAYDVRGPGGPRPTALASLIRELSHEPGLRQALVARFPALAEPGWWMRPSRLLSRSSRARTRTVGRRSSARAVPPVLITGAAGTLGQAYQRICEERGIRFVACSRARLDISRALDLAMTLDALRPWAVINAAGYVRVDAAESDCMACYRDNFEGPRVLADECARRGLPLLTFSTDLVFDGAAARPYLESDAVRPTNVYGRSKAAAEAQVLRVHPDALVVRTSAFFGPWDRYNFVTLALEALGRGAAFTAASDVVVSPTYLPDLAQASLDLLLDRERGVWHLANRGAVTWADLARRAARLAAVDPAGLVAAPGAELGFVACRPRYSALGSERGLLMPELDSALVRYVAELAAEPRSTVAA